MIYILIINGPGLQWREEGVDEVHTPLPSVGIPLGILTYAHLDQVRYIHGHLGALTSPGH